MEPYLARLQVPEVVRTDFQLIDISEDGFVSAYPVLSSYHRDRSCFCLFFP